MSAYSDAVLALNPVAYWRLGEVAGVTAEDETGDYDGTYVNTPTLGVDSLIPSDPANKAVSFASASQEYVGMDYANLRFTTPFTIVLWMKNATAAHQCLYSTMASYNAGGLTMMLHADKNFYVHTKAWSGGATSVSTVGVDVIDNAPHMLCATLSGGTGRVFVDGVEENSGALVTPVYGTEDGPWISRRNAHEYYANGVIDEVAVFDYALSPAEIANLYTLATTVAEETTCFACESCTLEFFYNPATMLLLRAECSGPAEGYQCSFKVMEHEGETWEDSFTAAGSKDCPYEMAYTDDGEGGIGNIEILIQFKKA